MKSSCLGCIQYSSILFRRLLSLKKPCCLGCSSILFRRLSSLKKPDVVVQVVVLAEDRRIQNLLKEQDLIIPTCAEIAPIQVLSI